MIVLRWRFIGEGKWLVICDGGYQVLISEDCLATHDFDTVMGILTEKFYVDHNVMLET